MKKRYSPLILSYLILSYLILSYLIVGEHCYAQQTEINALQGVLKTAKADTNKVKTLQNLCWAYNGIGLYDTSLLYGKAALQLSQQLNFKKGIATSHIYIGMVYQNQCKYSFALDNLLKGLHISEEIGNKKSISSAYGNIGNVYSMQGDFPKAIDFYLKALKMDEVLGNKNGIKYHIGNIGSIYFAQEDYAKALDYYFRGLKIAEELGDKNQKAVFMTNIGNIYSKQSNYSKATDYYFKALKMDHELEDKNSIAKINLNLGIIYTKQASSAQASYKKRAELLTSSLDYYLKALKMGEALGDKNLIATILTNIGSLFISTKKYPDAEKYLLRALAISDSIGTLFLQKETQKNLSELYLAKGEYKKAYEYYEKYSIAKDSLFNLEKNKELVSKAMTYEFDKKEATTKANQDLKDVASIAAKKKASLILILVVAVLIFVFVFAGFIFRSLRITRKQKGIIELQKNEVSLQKEEAEKQKHLVEEKQKEIVASITYAKRIQTALLTSDEYIQKHLQAEHFVLFKPKDIVSGDFYWAHSIAPLPGWDMGTNKVKLPLSSERKHTFYIATADCTGHGVPGAFMSMLNISYLHENIVERGVRLPNDILNSQRKKIIQALNPSGSTEECKDGMDCVLCVYDFDKMLLHFAAANNPLWLIRNGELTEFKGDKMPVGKYSEKMLPFTLQTIALQKDDIIYTSTDGMPDQFGGPKGKKFMSKQLKELLVSISHLPMQEQKQRLDTTINNWIGELEQVDDISVIGIKI